MRPLVALPASAAKIGAHIRVIAVPNLVHNEKTKLFANALERASTGCFLAGTAGPLIAATFSDKLPPMGNVLIGAATWAWAAIVVHLQAQRVLRNLRE